VGQEPTLGCNRTGRKGGSMKGGSRISVPLARSPGLFLKPCHVRYVLLIMEAFKLFPRDASSTSRSTRLVLAASSAHKCDQCCPNSSCGGELVDFGSCLRIGIIFCFGSLNQISAAVQAKTGYGVDLEPGDNINTLILGMMFLVLSGHKTLRTNKYLTTAPRRFPSGPGNDS
jgi:hypothetical protein